MPFATTLKNFHVMKIFVQVYIFLQVTLPGQIRLDYLIDILSQFAITRNYYFTTRIITFVHFRIFPSGKTISNIVHISLKSPNL